MRLIEFTNSPRPDKRFMAKFIEPTQTIHFGSKKRNTHVDVPGGRSVRERHIDWYLTEEVMTQSVLWGPTRSVEGNLAILLYHFRIQDDR